MSDIRISFIVSAFNRPDALRVMLSSLVCQTEKRWEALVMDRCVSEAVGKQQMCYVDMDSRIKYCPVPRCRNIYFASEEGAARAQGDWLAFPSDDGYYVPQFAERLIALGEEQNLGFVYCDLVWGRNGVHTMLDCYPQKCSIDKTNFIIRRKYMTEFPDKIEGYEQADGAFIEQLVKTNLRHGKVPQLLAVHN